MIEDEIVREVRAAREAFAARYGFDLRAIVEALREVAIASGRDVVRFDSIPTTRPILPQRQSAVCDTAASATNNP